MIFLELKKIKKKAEFRYDIIKQRYKIILNEFEVYKLNNLTIPTHFRLNLIYSAQIEQEIIKKEQESQKALLNFPKNVSKKIF